MISKTSNNVSIINKRDKSLIRTKTVWSLKKFWQMQSKQCKNKFKKSAKSVAV